VDQSNAERGRPGEGIGQRSGLSAPTPRNVAYPPEIPQLDRAGTTVVGAALLAYGLSRRSLPGIALAAAGGELLSRGITGRSVLVPWLVDRTFGARRRGDVGARGHLPEAERAITIGRPADELDRFWRDPGNFSRIMAHFADVTATGEGRAHWVVRGPLGRRLEWDTRIVEDRPGECVRWVSLDGALVPNEGVLRFRPAPGDRGTEIFLRLRFVPPVGSLGKSAAKLLGIVPNVLAEKSLRRFKSLVETGEIPTTACQPAGRDGGRDPCHAERVEA
jgi:uncharacterized membrane protein